MQVVHHDGLELRGPDRHQRIVERSDRRFGHFLEGLPQSVLFRANHRIRMDVPSLGELSGRGPKRRLPALWRESRDRVRPFDDSLADCAT